MLKIIPRHQLDATAWDACVAASPHRIVYGYSWYLDALLPAPSWKWIGLVLTNEVGQYQGVMPISLRRKRIVGISKWVVHQPFFCQFLGIFSRGEPLDPTPFFELLMNRFRYSSVVCTRQPPDNLLDFSSVSAKTTHILDLDADYESISRNYTRDRQLNLRRGFAANWIVVDSTDPEPLLRLFRENHADAIDGGVADWAYDLFRNVVNALTQRRLVTLRYALRDGGIEAGALFVKEGNRLIYLFNAASETGRRGNARTLLIDQMIRDHAGSPLIFDFESPEKSSVRDFYKSFGATEEPFWVMRWNRLSLIERIVMTARRKLK
ncbi:GNAT family N-acetyltransferase [Spirosoma areae]